jgi:hypothetical protein
VRIITKNTYSIYVYPEDHPPPHCHIRYRDKGPESVIGLPILNLLIGRQITKQIKDVLISNLDKLIKAWQELNPTDNGQQHNK